MPKYAKTKGSKGSGSAKKTRYVPFARGFKHRDEKTRRLALGFRKSEDVPREFSCVSDSRMKVPPCSTSTDFRAMSPSPMAFFRPVPQPTSQDDWLAQYVEEGQTYPKFLKENPWLSDRKVKYLQQTFRSQAATLSEKYPDGKICLVQLGKFDNKYLEFSELADYTSRFLCLPVEQLPPLELEVDGGRVVLVDDPVSRGTAGRSTRVKRTHLDCRYDACSGHLQLRVDSVLNRLRALIPAQALCLIALTTLDLYGDDTDLFVAGMAAGLNRVALFSLCRYDPTLTFSHHLWHHVRSVPTPLSFPDKSRLMIQRSCKLVVHEILHLLGLDHCVFYDCCMNGSGHLEEDFRQPMHLCPVDLRKLHTLVGFDVRRRYASLMEFYAKHGLEAESKWVERRLKFLDCAVLDA